MLHHFRAMKLTGALYGEAPASIVLDGNTEMVWHLWWERISHLRSGNLFWCGLQMVGGWSTIFLPPSNSNLGCLSLLKMIMKKEITSSAYSVSIVFWQYSTTADNIWNQCCHLAEGCMLHQHYEFMSSPTIKRPNFIEKNGRLLNNNAFFEAIVY